MKTQLLALICLINVALFASCKKDKIVENQEPSISIFDGEGFVADGDIVQAGRTVKFGFRMASSPETHKSLKSLTVTVGDTEWANITFPNTTWSRPSPSTMSITTS